jgi:hypothetical protein
MPDQKAYAIGLDQQNQKIAIPSVLSAVPMWFGLLDTDKTQPMIDRLAGPDFQTDWGMRIISSREPKYDPGAYHAGSVWPLFTGWAAVGEYRYHRALTGYTNLRTNASLTGAGALGHVTEVLSGNYFRDFSPSSPHQIWSAAMVAAPLLRGLFGLEADANTHTLVFAPHVPADWPSFSIKNVRVRKSTLDLNWSKTPDAMRLEVTRQGDDTCTLEFSPAISLRAKVRRVLLNGRSIPFHVDTNAMDQHVTVHVATTNVTQTVTIEVADDFGLAEEGVLPLPGSVSQGTGVTGERWSPRRDVLYVELAGHAGAQGELQAWDAREIASAEGATIIPGQQNIGQIRYQMPQTDGSEVAHLTIAIHFRDASQKSR